MQSKIVTGSIPKQLLRFFFPIWAGTFFQFFYNTADAMIVGNALGKDALSAVGGPSATIISLIVGFFVGLASGTSVVVSQLYGSKNKDGTSKAVHTAAALALVTGVVITVLGISTAPFLLRIMGTPESIIAPSLEYMNTYYCGIIFIVIYNIGSGVLHAVGDSHRPFIFLVVCCVANIVLDVLFVIVFPLGVAGAALATVLAQALSAILITLALTRTSAIYKLHISKIRFHKKYLRRVLFIGMPAGLQNMMYGISNFIIHSGVNGFGSNAVAAWSAYGKIDGLFWMTISSFGIAITTFVGQNFGARQFDRVKKSVRVCFGFTAIASLVLGVVLMVFGPQLFGFFVQDTEVISIGVTMMACMVPFYLLYIPIEVLSGALRGAGDVFMPTLIPAIGICVLRAIWVFFVVPAFPHIETLCFSYPVTWLVTSLALIVYYKKGNWMNRGIERLNKKHV